MNAAPHFAQTYREARDMFLAAARSCGARISADGVLTEADIG